MYPICLLVFILSAIIFFLGCSSGIPVKNSISFGIVFFLGGFFCLLCFLKKNKKLRV